MFAVLHIADFSLYAVLRTEQATVTGPAALFSGTGKKSLVLATNDRARAAGVELGMTAPQAVARCENLLIRAPRADAEAEARAALLAVGFTLSPALEDTASGICTIDLKGADPANLVPPCRRAIAELAALGLPATAGIARTPLLALYAARAAGLGFGGRAAPQPRKQKTPPPETCEFGTTCPGVLHVTDQRAFLAPLPLAAADPSPELATVLHNWGLRTLGDLTALPCEEMVRRFGTAGLALWQRAAGGEARPLHPVAPPQQFFAQMELEHEIETLEPLLFLLRRFLDRLTLELRASQHVAAELRLSLRLEDEKQHERSFRLPEPTAEVEILFRALHTHLESLQTETSICAIELKITPARPLVRQQGLFETSLRDPHGFAETLARVAALVGNDRLGTPQREDTHRPDAFKLVPPTAVIPPPLEPTAPVAVGTLGLNPALHPPLGLPLRRFRPPLRAQLEFTDGKPTYLWTEQVRGEIVHLGKPWQSNGEWWQADRTWQRIEWDIALVDGTLCRLLFKDESYFLEGEYD